MCDISPAAPTEHLGSVDELFKERILVHKAKQYQRETDPTLTPRERLRRTIKTAEENLTFLRFQSSLFGSYLNALLHANQNKLFLQHPKHQPTLLLLKPSGHNGLNLSLVNPTTDEKELPLNFEIALKLARRLQTPDRTFDTFLELFGSPERP